MKTNKIGRIGGIDWTERRAPHVTAIYNANYDISHDRADDFPKPWTASGPHGSARFDTHTEALAWAINKIEALK